MESMHTELRVAEALLQRGVRVKVRTPLLFSVTLKLRHPTAGTLHRVASYYLRSGITQQMLESVSVEDALMLMVKSKRMIYRAVAAGIINSFWLGVLIRPLAFWLSWGMNTKMVISLLNILIVHGGLEDFMSTTRLIRQMKLTAPNLGQKTKGS